MTEILGARRLRSSRAQGHVGRRLVGETGPEAAEQVFEDCEQLFPFGSAARFGSGRCRPSTQ